MNSNIFWKIAFVVLVVAWSISEMNPPIGRDLIGHFEKTAQNKDAAFDEILAKARQLEKTHKARSYGNLVDAVGANTVITNYFPSFDVSNKKDPTRAILQRIQKQASGQIQLGIDLQGGTYFVVALNMQTNIVRLQKEIERAGTNDTLRASLENELEAANDKGRILGQAAEVMRKRVDSLGVAEPIIQPMTGDDRIVIQLPGLGQEDLDRAEALILKAAFLEFRLVHERSEQLVDDGIIPPGYELMTIEERAEKNGGVKGQKFLRRYVVSKNPERGMTGKYVRNARVDRDQMTNRPYVIINFNAEGGELFGEITTANVDRLLAVVLDGELYSAATILGPITGGTCIITGDFTIDEANELANVLENPLEVPVIIEEKRTTDPSLGADSIRSGFTATMIGLGLVVVFMLIYYMSSGVVANVALALNLIVLLGVMCSINATLTLPGIAGILLTIGMAVDANVLIFERIREESRSGKGLRSAINSGYDKAFGTIFDANSTTLIASGILIFLGTGSVKGFGITLSIGIAVSMFTSLVVTRIIFDVLVANGFIKKLPMLQFGFLRDTNFDFLKYAKPAFILSWVLVFAGIAYGVSRGSDAVGVDFKGGDQITYTFENKVEVDQLRATITGLDIGGAQIQYQQRNSKLDQSEFLTVLVTVDNGKLVTKALIEAFPDAKLKSIKNDSVGATVGREIQKSAIIAILLAMFCILIYVAFRYEFSFAVAAVMAIFHDVFMTLGWFFLSGRELSAPMVAAVLTIIGFSINDTIVIFDRIREDLKMGLRGSFKDIINRAVNQTLARTVITSGTTLLSAGALFVFGGGVINDFAFTFLVGVVTGTYSSIYIASAIVLYWHKGEKPKASPNAYNESAVVVPGS
jgi:SecD/SecF fusion protein